MDAIQWKQEIATFLGWFVGWSLLEKVVNGGTVVISVAWLTARAKQSRWQRELLGATIAFALASALLLAIFAFETFPLCFLSGAFVGVSVASAAAFVLFRIRRQYSLLADEDVSIMEQRIHYLDVGMLGEPQGLASTAPFIEFHLDFINASVRQRCFHWWHQVKHLVVTDNASATTPSR